MLGRFICPAAKLNELLPFVSELFDEKRPLVVSALGEDAKAIEAFRGNAGARAVVDVLELKMPAPTAEVVRLCPDAKLRPFCEGQWNADWDRRVGFKLRTGGVEAKAFPSPEQVAFAITTCRDVGVPMKFTAGLHHPIRHYNESVKTKMHGFINVFAAATIAHTHREVDANHVQAILEDEDARSFSFDNDGLRWKSLSVTTPQIEAARRAFAISFGSCSFDEPRDDLRALGWL